MIQLLITNNSLMQNIMKVSDSSIISESPHQQINNGLSQDQALQKYPWLRISGSGSCGQLATHCPSLSLHNMHSFTIHHSRPGCCGAVGLDNNNNNNHTIISERASFAASASPECPVAALLLHPIAAFTF